MNEFLTDFIATLQRASFVGLAALFFALAAQWALEGRVPAAWRVWLWRAALLQTACALVPIAPLRLAWLPPKAEPTAAIKSATPRQNASTPPAPQTKAAPQIGHRTRSSPWASTSSQTPFPAPLPAFPGEEMGRGTVRPALPDPQFFAKKLAPHLDFWCVVLGFYALGIGFQGLILMRSLRRLRHHLRFCQPVKADAPQLRLNRIAADIGVKNPPRLLKSTLGAPFLVGIWQPAIVLPAALLSPNHPDLDAVLCHELAHFQRRDLAWNGLMRAVQLIFWFHPLVWVGRRFLALETESACDEMVLGSLRIAPATYGALLLNTMNTQKMPLSVGLTDDFGALETRLLRLDRAARRPHRVASWAFAGALSLAFGALVPLKLVARAQTRISTPLPAKIAGSTAPNFSAKVFTQRNTPTTPKSSVTRRNRVSLASSKALSPRRASRKTDLLGVQPNQPRRFPVATSSPSEARFSAPAAMRLNVSWRAPVVVATQDVARRGAVTAPSANPQSLAETALIALARQKQVNLLIDSSAIDPLAPPIPADPRTRGPQDNVVAAMLSRAGEFRLSSQYPDAKTFLLWAEPDQKQIVQAIFRGEGVGTEPGAASTDEELLLALRTQLDPDGVKQERAAQERVAAGFAAGGMTAREAIQQALNVQARLTLETKLSQLPLELQKQVAARFLPGSVGQNPAPGTYAELWTRDELWQRARVWLRPGTSPEEQEFMAAQRQKVEAAGQKWAEVLPRADDLVVRTEIEDGNQKLRLSLYPIGSVGAEAMFDAPFGAPLVAAPGLLPGKIRVLSPDQAPEAAVMLNEVQTTPGSALSMLQRNAARVDLSGEIGLNGTVSLEATRRPLNEFLRDATRLAGASLALSPGLAAQPLLISARLEAMPVRQLMQHVAHIYGATWTKDAANRFTLTSRNLSPLEMQLLRVGNMTTYRFRDNNVAANGDRRAEFGKFQNGVIAQAGQAITQEPGIAFTALPLATQRELRRRALENIERRVVRDQIEARNLLQGDWTIRLQATPRGGTSFIDSPWQFSVMALIVDGDLRRNYVFRGLPRFNLARLWRNATGNLAVNTQQTATNLP